MRVELTGLRSGAHHVELALVDREGGPVQGNLTRSVHGFTIGG